MKDSDRSRAFSAVSSHESWSILETQARIRTSRFVSQSSKPLLKASWRMNPHNCWRERLPRTQLGVERAAVLKLGSLRESSKSLTTKENRREETVPYS